MLDFLPGDTAKFLWECGVRGQRDVGSPENYENSPTKAYAMTHGSLGVGLCILEVEIRLFIAELSN